MENLSRNKIFLEEGSNKRIKKLLKSKNKAGKKKHEVLEPRVCH